MYIVCSDLEGVWIPEVWLNVAKKTGIEELKLTTRDIKDYDELMQYRLKILDKHNLKLKDIQNVIATIEPLEGALETMQWIKERTQLIVVSDTFMQFAKPFMEQLDWPTLFCHNLEIDENDKIINYHLRQKDPKRQVVKALNSLQYQVVAFGDSYNDVTMLEEADSGILFKPPQNVIDDFPQYPVENDYVGLKKRLSEFF
jgi:phosphoserine/homoserine phosphotransferase